MEKLTDESYKDFIKDGIAVIDAWAEKCPGCDNYAPTFETISAKFPEIKFGKILVDRNKPSEFKREYMKAAVGEKLGTPMTFYFKEGVFIRRSYGNLSATNLEHFIKGEPMEPEQTPQPEKPKTVKELTVCELEALCFRILRQANIIEQNRVEVFNEIELRYKRGESCQ